MQNCNSQFAVSGKGYALSHICQHSLAYICWLYYRDRMKAAFIEEFGPPDVIQHCDFPMPDMAPEMFLVKVTATTVNFAGTCIRSGPLDTRPRFPFIRKTFCRFRQAVIARRTEWKIPL